jgi:GAF domain-containing protein
MAPRPPVHDDISYRTTVEGLFRQLNQIGNHLQPFLDDFLRALNEQCPDITSAEIFLQSGDAAYQRAAGVGLPSTPVSPAPGSPAEKTLVKREPVKTELKNDQTTYAVPLMIQAELVGALQVNLPAGAPSLPVIQDALAVLSLPLSLVIKHLQTAPLARALNLSQQLATMSKEQDMLGIVAEYVGEGCSLVELAIYEYEDDRPVRVRVRLRSMAASTELADFSSELEDYSLSAAVAELNKGYPIQIDNLYKTSLIAPDKRDYFRAQEITRLTLLPLMISERPFGILTIAGPKMIPDELRGLQVLANHLTVQLQNRTLLERTASALDEVQQLYRFGGAILQANDPPTLLQSVYEQFTSPPDELALEQIHLDTEGKPVVFVTQAIISRNGLSSGTLIDVATYHLESCAQALLKGTPLLVNNLKTDVTMHPVARTYFVGRGMQAMGMFPIMSEGKLTNAVTAAYAAPHIFTAVEIRLLHRLSEQIGLEVRNWQLLQTTQEQTKQLSHQVRLLESLYETARQINTNLTDPDLLQTTCRRLMETLELEYVALVRFDQTGQVVAEHPVRLGLNTIIALDDFPVYKHLQKYQTPVIINQLETAVDLLGKTHGRLQTLGLQSLLLAPLFVQGELLGFLLLATIKQPRAFSQEEINVAQAIASQLAISLRNARLFHSIRQRASFEEALSQITSQLQEQADLRNLLQQTMHDLGQVLGARRARVLLQSESDGARALHPKG